MPTPNFASSSLAWYSWMFMRVSLCRKGDAARIGGQRAPCNAFRSRPPAARDDRPRAPRRNLPRSRANGAAPMAGPWPCARKLGEDPRQPGVHRRPRSRRLPQARARGVAARRRDGCRKRPSIIPSGSRRGCAGWSTRSTARATSSAAGPGWAVSVALVSESKPLIASLVAPARGETWSATAGQGAWRNGERLRPSTRATCPGRAFRPIRCRRKTRT